MGIRRTSGDGRWPRTQPARKDRLASKRVPRRWDGPHFGDGPQARKNVSVCDAHEEGARKFAVKLVVPGTEVVVAGATPLVAPHMQLDILHLVHRIRRRDGDEHTALEEREGEYSNSALIPHERRRRHQGTAGISSSTSGKDTRA